jgi:hypothetical protein
MADEKIDYLFNQTSSYEYNLELTFSVKNKIIGFVFNQSKQKLQRKGHDIKGNPEQLENFDVCQFDMDSRFKTLIQASLGKQIRQIEKAVLEEGIKVITSSMKHCYFKKITPEWFIKICLEGEFVKV